ncbi:hypothetical protein QN345_03460 [Cryobacterium sp. 10I1]|uniref:hypothetical protein n=1 Tax=Cryobacterium sp. 10I1 TaxID=3048578 RepID=UPI002B23DA4D|nr:hypothetical protein [Cryobacterium sp. 10I1]MEB0304389.1 hypothetical protein [Cryobacterium sp. 10I1]
MKTEMDAHITKLQRMNSRIHELREITYHYDARVYRGCSEDRYRALANDYSNLANDYSEALRVAAADWPWPHLRAPSVPSSSDDTFYSSYDCPECFHDGTDLVFPAPPTCQRCGVFVEHVPL